MNYRDRQNNVIRSIVDDAGDYPIVFLMTIDGLEKDTLDRIDPVQTSFRQIGPFIKMLTKAKDVIVNGDMAHVKDIMVSPNLALTVSFKLDAIMQVGFGLGVGSSCLFSRISRISNHLKTDSFPNTKAFLESTSESFPESEGCFLDHIPKKLELETSAEVMTELEKIKAKGRDYAFLQIATSDASTRVIYTNLVNVKEHNNQIHITTTTLGDGGGENIEVISPSNIVHIRDWAF